MYSADRQSTRLLLDLQACQTQGSTNRGVGRYSRAFLEAIAANCSPIDLRVIVSDALPYQLRDVSLSPDRISRLPPLPNWNTPRDFAGGSRDSLDAMAYSAFAQRLNPDIVHVSHVFEGLGDRVPLPDARRRAPGQIFSATLYDLIPLRFQQHYFNIPELRPWYHSRMGWLRQADLLLAISESSRQDAIDLLGIEAWRVVTIHGGISAHFRPPQDRAAAVRSLQARYPLRDRFALYTGGDDYRKNIQGAIEGFAAVAPALRQDLQLVIVCSMADDRKRHFLDIGRSSGLGRDQLLISGFVSEDDLVAFYGACELFVFPSLYEGLGLPVLEAMACGAPTIGGNNSSIREIIGREDALFSADSTESIAQRITNVLTNAEFAAELRRHGVERSREFTWESTARRALEAFDEALSRARSGGAVGAAQGWIPRNRLAVLTPLPPRRSGIADYNAQFLPHLARHFEIDLYVDGYVVGDASLNASFRIFDVADFERVATSYNAILYEFGNSEFHVNMLRLIERYPGVVGLHDAYLSGLHRYAAMIRGQPHEYRAEMLAAHGPRARRFFARTPQLTDPDETAMVELPCTKGVLDRALGVISHSPYNLAIARENYPEGWLAPYRTIPQMVVRPARPSKKARERVRGILGFEKDDFIIVSFGHVAWTKWGDRVLEAFISSKLRANRAVHLVFAGELSKDTFGAELRQAIAHARIDSRIRITGYLVDDEYAAYLTVADLAVQLRIRSRGGTPKGVLDCMARGVPVVVNNDASYTDYPDDVAIKLPSVPSVDEIAAVVERAFDAPEWRSKYSEAGFRYVAEHHSPGACAAEYAAVIHEFVARNELGKPATWIDAFAPALAGCDDARAAADAAASWLESLNSPNFRRRRIYIDVSHIARSDHETGVPRVVKEVVRALYATPRAGLEPIAVELQDGTLRTACGWLEGQGLVLAHECALEPKPVEFAPGDVLLMLDSSWARYSEFHPMFSRARAAHVPVMTVVYDLLPITLPPGNIVDGGKEWFEGWLRDAVASSDALICISRSVAEELRAYLQSNALDRHGLAIGFWHLGGDFDPPADDGKGSEQVGVATTSPYLLMVGTIDPRKSHALALEAMEILWARGNDLRLVIAGKEGWMVESLMEQLRGHRELGHRLHLVERPTDRDIAALYAKASGLLFLSKGEGFGLPLVEAANYGVPIVCSDLPVFREVAGSAATYVASGSARDLAEALSAWWERCQGGQVPDTRSMPRLTWAESAEELLNVITGGSWLWRKQ